MLGSQLMIGKDWAAQSLALDELVADHVVLFYEDQAAIDHTRLTMMRHAAFDAPLPKPPPEPSGRVTYAQLRAAAQFEPAAFRAFWKIMGMTCLPEQVYTDPNVIAATHGAIREHGIGLHRGRRQVPDVRVISAACGDNTDRSTFSPQAGVSPCEAPAAVQSVPGVSS
jgi:hypothetical protein